MYKVYFSTTKLTLIYMKKKRNFNEMGIKGVVSVYSYIFGNS